MDDFEREIEEFKRLAVLLHVIQIIVGRISRMIYVLCTNCTLDKNW